MAQRVTISMTDDVLNELVKKGLLGKVFQEALEATDARAQAYMEGRSLGEKIRDVVRDYTCVGGNSMRFGSDVSGVNDVRLVLHKMP